MKVPTTVSGRPVTNRGVHGPPTGNHGGWVPWADCYWIPLLQSMHMSWMTLLSDSDAVLIQGAAEALLDGGIIPVVRFAYQFPDSWNETVAVKKLAALYSRYNAPLIVQFANEPFDIREWKDKKVPPKAEAWDIIARRWHTAARIIIDNGGIAGFPDGPCYGENPFTIIGDDAGHWAAGRCIYLAHNYGKGRPLDYPCDEVSRFGTPLTMDGYRAALDDYADDPAWNEGPTVLAMMNQQRKAWANPDLTAVQDDVCWRGWERTVAYSQQAFGFTVQMALTEGGWVPRDRAGGGGGHPVDIRWPYTTPRMVAQKTLAMFEAESPFEFQTPWLLGDDSMVTGGYVGWPYDAWVGWAYFEDYGFEKPVVQALQVNPPGDSVAEAAGKVRRAKRKLTEALAALG